MTLRKAHFILLIFTIIQWYGISPAVAQNNQEQLESVQKELKAKQQGYAEVKQQEQHVLSELRSIDESLKKYTQQLQAYRDKLARNTKELHQIQTKLARLQQRFQQQRTTLAKRLKAIYKMGDLGYMAPLLALSSQPDLQQQLKYLQLLSTNDLHLIQAVNTNIQAISAQQKKLEQQKQDIVKAQQEIQEQEKKIAAQKQQKATLLASLQQDKQQFAQIIKGLEEAAGRLENLLENLGEEQENAALQAADVVEANAPGKEIVFPDNADTVVASYAKPFRSNRGKLLWPVQGKIITNFGKIKYGETYTFYKGVDIQSTRGTPFYAVFGGTVKYADWFKDYGNLIILDHGGNYFTLYAHADEITVKPGDLVETRQMLGKVGDTDSIKGSHLYFEIRANGKPVDPQQWLARVK